MTPLDDVVEVAGEQTLSQGGDVEFFNDEAALRLVERCRGIAASLRFRLRNTTSTVVTTPPGG